MSINAGMTARAPFTVDDGGRKTTLIDKHIVVLALQDDVAMCMYTGTDDGAHLQRLPGYVSLPQHSNVQAGWKSSGKFYADAGKICLVPVRLLQPEGSVSAALLREIVAKVVKLRTSPTRYDASAQERRTGEVRKMKAECSRNSAV